MITQIGTVTRVPPLALRPPQRPKWGWLYLVLSGGYAVVLLPIRLAAVLTEDESRFFLQLGLDLLMASMWALLWLSLGRNHIELRADGIRVMNWPRRKGRLVRWDEIDHLSVDPRGGPRIARLWLHSLKQVPLPVREEDLPAVREWVHAYLAERRNP